MSVHPPQPIPRPPGIPTPRDLDYPGVITLEVDATDTERAIFSVRETIPVTPGPMTLLYPEWLPGFHSPAAQIELLAGLILEADGKTIAWRRDPVEVYAFHLIVPETAKELTATFQYLSPTHSKQGRVTVTPNLLEVQWNTVILHPAGHFARRVMVRPVLKLPQGWAFACPLGGEADAANTVRFETTPLDALVDSPLLAGRHFKRVGLDENIHLNIAADLPSSLEISAEQIEQHRRLIQQADRLFRSRHFDRYEFLLTLSDVVGDIGVEHHRCCEISSSPSHFTSWDKRMALRGGAAHEYLHSWNGKFRRGADSWTPCFHHPIGNSLMWVYEGLTQYLGTVLSTRAGIWTVQNTLDQLASTAGRLVTRKGRRWRAMSDTTRDPIIAGRKALPWASWQRNEDYYQEGMFVWLEVDTLIRERSGGNKSLDDFVADFFGRHDGEWTTSTYEFGDVIDCLQQVTEYGWAQFFQERLHGKGGPPPLDGLLRAGYRLDYKSSRNDFARSQDECNGSLDLSDSIGLIVAKSGNISEVIWESPAFAAGLVVGARIRGVNAKPFSLDVLDEGIGETPASQKLVLSVEARGELRERVIPYADGPHFPHLERVNASAPLLEQILAPR